MRKEHLKKSNADDEMIRNGAEISVWLRITRQEVSLLKKRGVLPYRNGFPLMECVWAYQDYKTRSRKAIAESTQIDMERDAAEKLHWQAENEKAKNREWREAYGMDLAERYRDSLAYVFDSVRDFYERRGDIEGADFIESVAKKVKSGDLHAVVSETSGNGEDDSDD